MPLMELDPPSILPRTQTSGRLTPPSDSMGKCQAYLGSPRSLANPLGIPIMGLVSAGPASSSRTRHRGSSDRRYANTHPADPAPTMIWSYTVVMAPLRRADERHSRHIYSLFWDRSVLGWPPCPRQDLTKLLAAPLKST